MSTNEVKATKDKITFWLAIVSVITALCYYMFFAKNTDIEAVLHQTVPEADNFEQINKEPLAFKALKDNKVIYYCAIDKARGYQSLVAMLAVVDPDGNLKNVAVIEQQETPVFFGRLINKKFIDQFAGQKINNGFKLGENIDAVTGATVSSTAVTRAVNNAVKYIGASQLDISVRDTYSKVEFGRKEIFLIIVMALAVYATYRKKAGIRTFVLVFTVVVLGFWYNTFITYGMLASLLGGSLPPPQNLNWYVLVGGTLLLVSVTGKNLFCFWICPFGATQELIHKLGVRGFKVSPQIDKWAQKLPGVFAWFALVLAYIIGNPNIANFEPFATLFSQTGTNLHWLLLPLVLFASLIIYRFWCNYFCPVGYVMRLVAKLKRTVEKIWKKAANGVVTCKKGGRTLSS